MTSIASTAAQLEMIDHLVETTGADWDADRRRPSKFWQAANAIDQLKQYQAVGGYQQWRLNRRIASYKRDSRKDGTECSEEYIALRNARWKE